MVSTRSTDSSSSRGKSPGPKRAKSPGPKRAKSPATKTPKKSPAAKSKSPAASSAPALSKESKGTAATKQPHFEFGGTPGALGIIFGLPLVTLGLYLICPSSTVCMENPLAFDWSHFYTSLPSLSGLLSMEAVHMFLGWFAFNVFLERVLPGEIAFGAQLEDGSKLPYRMSGHLQFWICILAMGHAYPLIEEHSSGVYSVKGFMPLQLDLIYDHYMQLIVVSVIFSFALSAYLYARSFNKGAILAKGGDTGYAIYDFFIGRELNPRIGSFDWKEFCELRPGLIGWAVINLGMAVKQYKLEKAYSGVGSISMSMVLVVLFQGFYVWDALYMEKAILTTMDITTDGFGFMLVFGDLAWVPFIYSLQARYLVDHDPLLSGVACAAISAVHFLGYYIFRSANSEKDAFRRDPSSPQVAHLTYMQTQRGTKLITSGWWGMARKINYTGDWLVTLSWCLLCGFSSPVPYFQAVYFLVLLIHRADRDDKMCAEKYGADWDEYKKKVPYVFIPYIW